MRNPSTSVLFLILAFLGTSLQAQDILAEVVPEKFSLKLNLAPHSTYRFINNTNQKTVQELMGAEIETNLETTVHYLFEIESNSGNEIKIKASFERFAFTMQMPHDTLAVDTDQDEAHFQPANLTKLVGLIDKPFYLYLDNRGKIAKHEGLSSLPENTDEENYSELNDLFSASSLLSDLEKTFNFFPMDSVGMGEEWHISQKQALNSQIDLTFDKTFTLESLSEDLAWVNINHQVKSATAKVPALGEVNISGTQEGTIEIERESGLVFFSESQQELEGNIQSYGMDIPLKISLRTRLIGEKI